VSSMEEGDDCECDLLELKDKKQSKDEQSKDEQTKDELDILLEHARIQVSILEDELKVANGEIKFLREELCSTQLSLLSSRSEVSTLLEELTTYRSGKEWKEEFPDLLLSSLDKLYQDKQQQLYLISGIHNSFQDEGTRLDKSPPDGRTTGHIDPVCKSSESPPSIIETKKRQVDDREVKLRKPNPCLTLELTKAYDTCSSPWNKRSLTTPCGIAPFRWTPTTPTPCSALRPSLSLHNLESKTFTEVLIPSIKPPDTHQVSPHNSASPKSPLIARKDGREQEKTKQESELPNVRNNKSTQSSEKLHETKNINQIHPQTTKYHKNFELRSSLSEISENLIFLECK